MKVAIFASGNGSNFESIASSEELKKLGLEIEILVCDQPQAQVLQRAKNHHIKTFVNKLSDYNNRSEYEKAIVEKLKPLEVEYILLAGYMRVVTKTLLSNYPNRIINIHPSLLPKYSGLEAIHRAFLANEPVTGVQFTILMKGSIQGLLSSNLKLSDYKMIQKLDWKVGFIKLSIKCIAL